MTDNVLSGLEGRRDGKRVHTIGCSEQVGGCPKTSRSFPAFSDLEPDSAAGGVYQHNCLQTNIFLFLPGSRTPGGNVDVVGGASHVSNYWAFMTVRPCRPVQSHLGTGCNCPVNRCRRSVITSGRVTVALKAAFKNFS